MRARRVLLTTTLILVLLVCMCLPALAADLKKIAIDTPAGSVPGTVKTETIQVMFNPSEVHVVKHVPWKHEDIEGLDAPALKFTSGKNFRIAMELVFDTSLDGRDVRDLTEPVEMAILQAGPNPIMVTWDDVRLEATVYTYAIVYTDFYPSGTPCVANMYCVFDKLIPVKQK